MSISEFPTFRELLLHCLKCHDAGDGKQALAFIDEYLTDSRAEQPPDSFWSEYNVQQALGFRVSFIEKMDKRLALGAEDRHLQFCKEQLRYWASACADSAARLAVGRFQGGDTEGGRGAVQEAARHAGILGVISVTVAQAAEESRKTV